MRHTCATTTLNTYAELWQNDDELARGALTELYMGEQRRPSCGEPGSSDCRSAPSGVPRQPEDPCRLGRRKGAGASLRDGPSAHPCPGTAAPGAGWLRGSGLTSGRAL
jgi:hypothetical protein